MREIKFRAWDSKKMVHFTQEPWVCSEYNSLCWEVDEENEKEYYGCLSIEGGHDNSYVLMQFTGLLDKNGKEIYEGDIVQETENNYDPKLEKKGEVGDVYWSGPDLGWNVAFKQKLRLGATKMYLQIIGNIYESKELLTPSKG